MKAVMEFNKKRNGFKLDLGLEREMIKEEIQEFYDAETLAERIDAMIDVRYVYEGTQMKCNYNFIPMDENITKIVGQFHRLSTTLVAEELGDNSQYLDKIMDKAWDIVCAINATKGTKLDENGKTIKTDDIENATEKIAEMLKELGYEN